MVWKIEDYVELIYGVVIFFVLCVRCSTINIYFSCVLRDIKIKKSSKLISFWVALLVCVIVVWVCVFSFWELWVLFLKSYSREKHCECCFWKSCSRKKTLLFICIDFWSVNLIHIPTNFWHGCLVHLLVRITSQVLRVCHPKINGKIQLCEACRFGKIYALPFQKSQTKSDSILELVHSDLWAPSR